MYSLEPSIALNFHDTPERLADGNMPQVSANDRALRKEYSAKRKKSLLLVKAAGPELGPLRESYAVCSRLQRSRSRECPAKKAKQARYFRILSRSQQAFAVSGGSKAVGPAGVWLTGSV